MARHLFESSEERSSHPSAIVAVIDGPDWDEDEAVEKEIREAFGDDTEHDTENEKENSVVQTRVLSSTSEEESKAFATSRTSANDLLPQV